MAVPPGIAGRLRRLVPAGLGSLLVRPGSGRVAAARWDEEYGAGAWSGLDSLFEMPRYAVLAGYCRRVATGRPVSVLDIGCGSGVLLRWLDEGGVADRYLGMDLSAAAIEQARAGGRMGGRARFVVADAEGFVPEGGERFDVVVLNEMLYYLDSPETLIARCAGFLTVDGAILLSMWRSPHALASWRRVAPLLTVQDEIRLRRARGFDGRPARGAEWHIRLCRPRTG